MSWHVSYLVQIQFNPDNPTGVGAEGYQITNSPRIIGSYIFGIILLAVVLSPKFYVCTWKNMFWYSIYLISESYRLQVEENFLFEHVYYYLFLTLTLKFDGGKYQRKKIISSLNVTRRAGMSDYKTDRDRHRETLYKNDQ